LKEGLEKVMDMKKFAVLLIMAVVFTAGCIGESSTGTTTTTSTQGNGLNFRDYAPGKVLSAWHEIFNGTFYASDGYEDLVKHYFPDAEVRAASEYPGTGILVLSPKDVYSKKILFGKPVQVQKLEPFGYIAYRNGMHYVGPWHGIVAIFNSKEEKCRNGGLRHEQGGGRRGTQLPLGHKIWKSPARQDGGCSLGELRGDTREGDR